MKWIDKIYIISLPDALKRQDFIWNDLLSAGFDASKIEFIEAVNGNDLDINECLQDGTISPKYRDPNGVLTKSIYGCALSHLNIYKDFQQTSDVETALILEDDANLTHTALRTLITDSSAYNYFIEDSKKVDWDVIQLGQVSKFMNQIPDDSIDTKILKKMEMPTIEWAAHSYIINKKGATKLIENNTPIQYAADVNIHTSNSEVYCPSVSYFLQRVGHHHRWMQQHLMNKFNRYILHDVDEFDLDYQSKTFYGDLIQKEEHLEKPIFEIALSRAIDAKKITFESFEIANGDTIEDWVTIHLKEETL
jgi:GR25 family glycosyltransferase involved in LPS biosynthesis